MDKLIIEIPNSVEAPFTKTLVVDGSGLELPEAEPRFATEGSLSVRIEPVGNGYVITGSLRIAAEMDCSRCLEAVDVQIEEPLRIILSGAPADASPKDDWFLLDTETREFDIAPLVRELVLIGLPVKPLCREDCLGLCPECGGDRNTGLCTCEGHRGDPRWEGLAVLSERLELHDVPIDKENVTNGGPKTESIKESQK